MSLLGLDWGGRYVGYATSDEEGVAITARGSFERKVTQEKTWQLFEHDVYELKKIISEWEITKIVLGLPLNADGSESPASVAATVLAGELATRLRLEVTTADERYTSWETALQTDDEHAQAAAFILTNYFSLEGAK